MTKPKSKKIDEPVIESEETIETKKLTKEKKVEKKKSVESTKSSDLKKTKELVEDKNNSPKEVNEEVSITSSNKKRKDNSSKKKEKVNRPPTAYNLFMKEQMLKISEGNQTDKLKTVAGLWKEITEEVRSGYIQRAAEIKEEFMTSQENKSSSDNPKNQRKRLPNGYNIYLKQRMSIIDGENQKEKLVKIAAEWKGLADNEKQKYKDQASQLKSEVEVSS